MLKIRDILSVNILLCCIAFSGVTLAKDSSEQAQAWLQRMVVDSENLNYSGIVSYQYGDVLVSAKMSQKVEGGEKQTRLVYLDGQQGEFFGAKKSLAAQGDQQLVDSNIKSLPERLSKLRHTYQLNMMEDHRIAGRDAVVVDMNPHDPFRYRHRLFIDKQTGLLLKTETMGDSKVPLERFQFVQLTLNSPDMKDSFMMAFDKAKQSFVSTMGIAPRSNPQDKLGWQVSWVPKGYSLVSSKQESQGRETCLYTDGMSSFSVYVEPMSRDFKGGAMRQGASVVISQSVDVKKRSKAVTVVGDIPVAAAERIIQSVRGVD